MSRGKCQREMFMGMSRGMFRGNIQGNVKETFKENVHGEMVRVNVLGEMSVFRAIGPGSRAVRFSCCRIVNELFVCHCSIERTD